MIISFIKQSANLSASFGLMANVYAETEDRIPVLPVA